MNINYYEILGVSYDSDKKEIDEMCKYLFKNSLIYQTDDYRKEIYFAYETLTNQEKREKYNKQLTEEDIFRINESHNLIKSSKEMFEKINSKIGSEIKVEYIWDNKTKTERALLEYFSPYEYLHFGKRTIPFIGKRAGIIKIEDITTNEIIYDNNHIASNLKEIKPRKAEVELKSWGIAVAYKHYDSNLKKLKELEEETSFIKSL